MRALSIAATGMQAQQTNVETIANNLANMNTTGFKQQRAEFEDLLYQNILTPGSQTSDAGTFAPNGIQIGAGVKTSAIYRINTQGDLQSTGNTYDVAVQGAGYFQIQQPDGTNAYTRSGNFSTSAQGQLVTQDGLLVLPGITVPNNAVGVTINTSGQVSITIDGQTNPTIAGQFTLATFPNEAGLEAEGNNIFLQTQSSGNPIVSTAGSPGFGTILQGYLEQSNVNVVSEITNLISAQRAYEMNSKVIQTTDSMLQTTSQLKGA